jgi:hypothetical protein
MSIEQATEIIQHLQNIEDILVMLLTCFVGFFIYIIFRHLISSIGRLF